MHSSLTLIHSAAYRGWVFDMTHPTQGRRFDNARELLHSLAADSGVALTELQPSGPASVEVLTSVHGSEYVAGVLEGQCDEWPGTRPDLGLLAATFVQGTLDAAELLDAGVAKTVVHFPGAKHHAMRDYSSGFCVFGDFAIAARTLAGRGHRVAILDIDAHRGDGTEELTQDDAAILTYSIHDESIFPFTPGAQDPARHIYNWPLPNGSGGSAMLEGVDDFIAQAGEFDPTVLFITAGADGHRADPLSTLNYEVSDYVESARRLRAAWPRIPVLIGGAGGYCPDDYTPQVWAQFALTMAA